MSCAARRPSEECGGLGSQQRLWHGGLCRFHGEIGACKRGGWLVIATSEMRGRAALVGSLELQALPLAEVQPTTTISLLQSESAPWRLGTLKNEGWPPGLTVAAAESGDDGHLPVPDPQDDHRHRCRTA